MIYYFSGTGNSRAVAERLGRELGEEVIGVAMVNPSTVEMKGERFILVFPVYSWGVPPIILDFIKCLPERFCQDIKDRRIETVGVMTCGDEVAKAPEMLIRHLGKRGIVPVSIWSVIMPNDYVLLPGFDVDSKDVEEGKLDRMPERVREIAAGIKMGDSRIDVVRGSMPWLKTNLVYPLFKRWGIEPKRWRANAACVGCGRCVKACPVKNIAMGNDRRPEWGDNCTSCLGCYHICPYHAVEYGKATRKKGQYYYG